MAAYRWRESLGVMLYYTILCYTGPPLLKQMHVHVFTVCGHVTFVGAPSLPITHTHAHTHTHTHTRTHTHTHALLRCLVSTPCIYTCLHILTQTYSRWTCRFSLPFVPCNNWSRTALMPWGA